MRAERGQLVNGVAAHIEHSHRNACLHQILGHLAPHRPQADETHRAQRCAL
jgi:hypothetical protein